MQTIYLDIHKRNELPRLQVKQRDVGRKFLAVITDGGVSFPVPADALLSVWYSGTSGEGHYSVIENRSAFSVEGNAVTVELIAQMAVNKGGGILCLEINRGDGTQIGLWNIAYDVEGIPGADSQEARHHFDAFAEVTAQAMAAAQKAEQAARIFTVDETLTQPGKAADAAAVGAAMNEKAPAGWGYGDTMQHIEAESGSESHEVFCARLEAMLSAMPDFSAKQADIYPPQIWGQPRTLGKLFKHSDLYALAEFISPNGYSWLIRKVNGAWQPLEWVNPPMGTGTEYRTTKWWRGLPIYTKYFDCGAGPNQSVKATDIGIGSCKVFSIEVAAVTGDGAVFMPLPSTEARAYVSSGVLYVEAYADLSGFDIRAVVNYTKE